jgi:hypothetical protein
MRYATRDAIIPSTLCAELKILLKKQWQMYIGVQNWAYLRTDNFFTYPLNPMVD